METEQIQLDLEKLHKQFNKKICEYYKKRRRKITWDNEYNIESELTEIKKIWSDVLYAECEEVMKSTSNDKNVNKDEVEKFYNERLKQYEDSWKLTDDNVPLYFLEAFEKETIDSSEKLKKLIDFTKNDLKFKDDFYDDYFMFYVIGLLKFDEKSTLTKENLFYVLDLNKKKDLGPDTLLKCVKKFRLDYSYVDKLLPFAENYKFPDEENENEDYKKQAKAFFYLIWCMLLYSKDFSSISDNVAKNLEIAQKIFAYINKNMPQFKHLFKKIDKYNKGVELSNDLNKEGCIKTCLSEKNSNDSDIKVAIDYFKWFNKFVSCKLYHDGYYKYRDECYKVDGLNELHDKFISDFSNEIKKYGIEIAEDIKKELLFDQESFDEILKKTNRDIIGSSNDFDKLIEFINLKTKEIDIASDDWHINAFYGLITDYKLQMGDIEKFLELDKNNRLSIGQLNHFISYKVDTPQKYKFDDITKFLLAAKNRFTKSKKSGNNEKREKDVKAFCNLLAYFLKYVDENETEYIKFEQDIFDWIGKNIPEVEFFEKAIKNSKNFKLKSKNFTNDELESDCFDFKEQFESSIDHTMHLKKTKYTEDTAEIKFFRVIKNSELKDALKYRWVKFNNSVDNKLEADFSYLQEQFESFVLNSFKIKKTTYKNLNKLPKARDALIGEFLKSKKVNQTRLQKVSKAGYEKDLKQTLKLRKSESIQCFIKKISAEIIKSSGDLKFFLENVDKVMGKLIDFPNYDSFMNPVIDLISDSSIDVDDILKVLESFLPKKDEEAGQKKSTEDKLKLITLLKCCQKIKNDQKWNLKQVKKFLKYGFADTRQKNISDSVDSFFRLLIIFVSNADLETKSKIDSNHPDEADCEDDKDIKNNLDITYEKFVTEILLYAKKLYFKQKKFSWSEHFEFCSSFDKLQEILVDKNINIPELQQNKLKNENKLEKNIGKRNKEIKNKDIKKIEKKNKNQIETNPKDNNKNKIGQLKKFDLETQTIHDTDPNENDEKIKNINFQLNYQVQIADQNKSKRNENEINEKNNENASKIYQKTNTDNSEHKDLQNKHYETISMPVTKISCLKLISKIVLYVLAVVAFVVLIFSIIKAFWFLAILSFILCPAFIFIALKIKHKTIDKQLENINTGYLNYRPEITEPNKNNKSEEVPEINDRTIRQPSHKN